jgi:hypothetical protein
MKPSTATSKSRSLLTVGLAFVASLAIVGVTPASARTSTFLSFSVGLPLYAGPPAYGPYYAPPYYYAPAPVYYAPPPVVVTPAPVAPACRSGLWRQTDGSVVNGVACFQPNGTWRLNNY